jgi:integrase/recombinase XerD
MWQSYIKGFIAYLQLEKSLSNNSVQAYVRDVQKLEQYNILELQSTAIDKIELKQLQSFLKYINEIGLEPTSQSRVISGLKVHLQNY